MESKEFNTEQWALYERTSRAVTRSEREVARLMRDARSNRRGYRLVLGPLTLMVRWRSRTLPYSRSKSVRVG